MDWLIWTGAAITVAGCAGLVFSIALIARAKEAKLDEDALKARIQSVVPINLAALCISAFGLIMVIVGLVLA